MKHRNDLQILRGIAVLMVVLFHLQIPFFANGFLGVDVFFVISGFLMAQLYDKGSIADFYSRRIDRLLPAYSLMIIAVLLVSIFVLVPVDYSQLYEQALVSSFFSNNIQYWTQNSYFNKSNFNPLLNLWSLSVEMQFYLVVPFLYPLLRKRKSTLICVFLLSLFGCFVLQKISPSSSFYLMPFRIWEFLIGAYVAWHSGADFSDSTTRRNWIGLVFVVLLLVSSLCFSLEPDKSDVTSGHPGMVALWIVSLTGATIYFGLPHRFESAVIGRGLKTIGDYSYSIYLVHFPIVVLVNYEPFGGTKLAANTTAGSVTVIVAILIASYLSYIFFEKKLARFYRKTPIRILSLFSIVVIAILSTQLNKLRFSVVDNRIFSASSDRAEFRCGKFYSTLNRNKPFCMLGEDLGLDRVLLVGNSHADSIKNSFLRASQANNLTLYFVAQNDPLSGRRVNAEIIVREALRLGIRSIVIHFSPNVYENRDSTEKLRNLLSSAAENNIQIVIFAPIPVYDVHIPKAMFQARSSDYDFVIDRSKHDVKTAAFRSFIQSISSKSILIYDPAEVLCPSVGPCAVANREGAPFYFDDGHLTLTGARQLEPLFESALHRLTNAGQKFSNTIESDQP